MKNSIKYFILLITLLALAIFAYFYAVAPKIGSVKQNSSGDSLTASSSNSVDKVGIANPASKFCTDNGGQLVIQNKDGVNGENLGQYGLCFFDDNRACEEWAMMRGDCPIGGRKTTGYDTIDQKFCAWSGGDTVAEPNSICTFKNGKKCSTIDFYNGKCNL